MIARLAIYTGALMLALGSVDAVAADAKKPHYPIIDFHAHALYLSYFDDIGYPNDRWTGAPTPRYTDESLARAALAAMDHYNVVKVVLSGRLREEEIWKKIAPDRFMLGIGLGGPFNLPVDQVRQKIKSGEFESLGEVFTQYYGWRFDDPEIEPYFRLAEETGITFEVHAGISEPSEVKASGLTRFRVGLGNPLNAGLEEMLVKFPNLRVALGHAGYPFAQETIGLMQMYPNLNVDLAAIMYAVPREGFYAYLRALINGGEGFDKRIMFGSDFYMWPESQIRLSVEAIDSAPFLTEDQKKDIFCRNAQRFLKLDPSVCEVPKGGASKKQGGSKP